MFYTKPHKYDKVIKLTAHIVWSHYKIKQPYNTIVHWGQNISLAAPGMSL